MSEPIAVSGAANFIAGRWIPSLDGSVYQRRNPWRPAEIVGEHPSSGPEDVAAAVGAAQAAYPEWSGLPAATRGAYLARAANAIEARVEEIAQGMTREMGKPLRDTEVGPLVNQTQFDAVLAGIERGREQGATVIAGGERADPDALLIAPTLFEGVADDAFLSCEEVFGPVASLYPFDTIPEAIERANAVRFGLSASVFTGSLETAQRCMDGLQAGILHVNSQTAGADVHVPFGGTKESGFGPHEQGSAAVQFYTEEITVYQDV
jgi:acyl-CoA reductase-like NAD-dependent aldehyde dehydrogenase